MRDVRVVRVQVRRVSTNFFVRLYFLLLCWGLGALFCSLSIVLRIWSALSLLGRFGCFCLDLYWPDQARLFSLDVAPRMVIMPMAWSIVLADCDTRVPTTTDCSFPPHLACCLLSCFFCRDAGITCYLLNTERDLRAVATFF